MFAAWAAENCSGRSSSSLASSCGQMMIGAGEAAPCDLPAWCSPPDALAAEVEVWRVPREGTPHAIALGARPWLQLGRRQQCERSRQPDLELYTRTASRKQAILLRNWHGQVFIMDLGSSHGTFLGRRKLEAKQPKEWRPGTTLFFADQQTETFELRLKLKVGSSLPVPPSKPASTGPNPSSFTGARRMMGAQMREEIVMRPKLSLEEEVKEPEPEVEEVKTVEVEKLYPGDWEVPADGLSNIGWKPAEEVGAVTPVTPKQEQVEASVCQDDLGHTLQQVLLERFGPDVLGTLRRGPHYPCPDKQGWQIDLWSGRSCPFDPKQVAIVVTKVTIKPSVGLTRHVSLEWLDTNVSPPLIVRLTDAPIDVAEPLKVGRWQLDMTLKETSSNSGVVSLSSCQYLPSKVFIRLCSHALVDGVEVPAHFGSTLRSLHIGGDSWALPGGETVSHERKPEALEPPKRKEQLEPRAPEAGESQGALKRSKERPEKVREESGRKTSPKGEPLHRSPTPITRKRSRSSSASRSRSLRREEELLRLPGSQLVDRLKDDIKARRLSCPDFKHARLRAAYSQALDLLNS